MRCLNLESRSDALATSEIDASKRDASGAL
jgi:hypothetical protein